MAGDHQGEGAPEPVLDGAGLRVAIVAARWNSHVTLRLLDGARRGLLAAGVDPADVTEDWVPGRSSCRSPPVRGPSRVGSTQ